MDDNSKSRLKEIHDKVLYMTYNEDNFFSIIKYINEAVDIAKQYSEKGNSCLNNLLLTKEKQLYHMSSNYEKIEEREDHFNDLKDNFLIDLSFNCDCLE